MKHDSLERLLGLPGPDPGCDAGFAQLERYCDAVRRGDKVERRFPDLVRHIRTARPVGKIPRGCWRLWRSCRNDVGSNGSGCVVVVPAENRAHSSRSSGEFDTGGPRHDAPGTSGWRAARHYAPSHKVEWRAGDRTRLLHAIRLAKKPREGYAP